MMGHSCCGIRLLWEISARWAGGSLAGPHQPCFAWELHLYAGPSFNPWQIHALVMLAMSLVGSYLLTWRSGLTSGLPHPHGLTQQSLGSAWPWYHHWTWSVLLAGVYHKATSHKGEGTAMPTVWSPLAPRSPNPVVQPVLLLPDMMYKLSLEICSWHGATLETKVVLIL